MVFDRDTGKPKGFGFVQYQDVETASSAVRNLNGFNIGGRGLRVDFAENEKEESKDAARSNAYPPPQQNRQPQQQSYQSYQQQRPFNPQQQGYQQPIQQGYQQHQPQSLQQGYHQQLPLPMHQGFQQQQHPQMQHGFQQQQLPPMQQVFQQQQPKPVQQGFQQQPSHPVVQSQADAISTVMANATPTHISDLLTEIKNMSTAQPEKLRELLNENPQLCYALFQAMLISNAIDQSVLQRILENTKQPTSTTAPAPAVAAPVIDPVQKQLLMQVMALTEEQILALPLEQRTQLIALRAQLMAK